MSELLQQKITLTKTLETIKIIINKQQTYKNGGNLLPNQSRRRGYIIIGQEVDQMLNILHTHGKTDTDAEGTVVVYVHYGELLSNDAVVLFGLLLW